MPSCSHVSVVGSINQDIVVTLPVAPDAGRTVLAHDCRFYPGGKGANQAVAAAAMNVATRFVGNVGSDPFGPALRDHLLDRNVDARINTVDHTTTGTASIWVEDSGENRIALSPGANHALEPDDAIQRAQLRADDIVVLQNEIPWPITTAVLRAARKVGAVTLLNVAPARPVAADVLGDVDYLIVNEHEYAAVFDQPLPAAAERDRIADALAGRAPAQVRHLIVTLGPAGVIGCINGEIIDLPAPSVRAVDTTGAGDCFVGVFAAGLAEALAPADALERAVRAAAISVTRAGAGPSFPARSELEPNA